MDLAVAAYFERLPESFRMRSLGRDPHVCVARKGSPFLRSRRNLEAYLKAEHVRIAVPPGRSSGIDRTLAKRGKSRRVVAHFNNFLSPPWVLSRTDFLLTCPESLARHYAEAFPLEIAELPVQTPPIEVKMVWHERNHADPFQRWMRETIAGISDRFQER